jgi:alpha-amylase
MDVCFYFQLHQPRRVRRYQVFDIGSGTGYFDETKNADTLRRVAANCYVPATKILTELARNEGARVSMSVSGVLVEQMARTAPEALESLQALVETGGAELLNETSHHSLSSLANAEEFAAQVRLHRDLMEGAFGVTPRVFRNTELIVSDRLTPTIAKLGFDAMLVEGADAVLEWRSPNFVYASKAAPGLRLLPRNYRLSDDVAFRFSARDWSEWPLTAEKYAAWIASNPGDCVNVFMDFETLGEHQHEGSGILQFLRALPAALRRNGVRMITPSEQAKRSPMGTLSYPGPMSWADTERDVSAWLGNGLQHAAHDRLYSLRESVLGTRDPALLQTWRELSTSDHFYYMSTKWHADGDVHTYFSPYATPYEAYISFMNVMRDLEQRVGLSALGSRLSAVRPKPSAKANGKPKAQGTGPKASVKAKTPRAESLKPRAKSLKPRAKRKK